MNMDLIGDLLVVFYYHNARDGVVVSSQIFCGAVCDNIRAKRERLLEIRGQKRVIHHRECIHALCDLRDCVDVRHLHHRVRRCLNEKHLRIRSDRRLHLIQIRHVYIGMLNTVFSKNVPNNAEGSAVNIIR